MAKPEHEQLELEHMIRYGTWEERAAHDPLPDPDLEADEDDDVVLDDEEDDEDDESIRLTHADMEHLDLEAGADEHSRH